MYPVSKEFMEKIRSNRRRVFAKIVIDYTSPFIDQSVEVTASENANFSYPSQTADGVSEPFDKIASLDGSWELDGTYALVPDPNGKTEVQIGWWGRQLSDEDGNFESPYPKLTMVFAPRFIDRLKVTGDSKRVEWPVDFEIRLYDDSDTLLYTETVTDNTEIYWQKELFPGIAHVNKMELEVFRWSRPGRQVKIMEFFISLQETYEGEDIISLNLLEERESSQGDLPVGNISSNEIIIKLNNETRRFDAGNAISPLYNLLRPNRRIRAWLGIEKDNQEREWVPLGVFWSGDWSVPEDDVYAQTTGRDRLEFLRRSEYVLEGVIPDMSLYDLAVDVLEDAGLTPEEYWIDEELQDYVIPYVKLEPQSHREVLRKIAEACLGQVYCDRHGIIRVEGTKPVSEVYVAYANEFANISYPAQVTDGVYDPFAKIASLDGSWDLGGEYVLAPEIETPGLQMGWWGRQLSDENGYFKEPYTTLFILFFEKSIEMLRVVGDNRREEYPVDFIVRVYDGLENLLSEQTITNNTSIIVEVPIPENPTNATKAELIITRWSHPGRQAKIVEFSDVVNKYEIGPDDYFRKDNPPKYAETTNYVVVKTQPIDSNGDKLPEGKVVAMDEKSITENGLLSFELPVNPLIQTEEMAQDIADRLLEKYKEPRRNLEMEWRGNPALLLGDRVLVTDSREINEYRIARQEIDFAGTLTAKLTGRRV